MSRRNRNRNRSQNYEDGLCSGLNNLSIQQQQPPRPKVNPNYATINNLTTKPYWGKNIHHSHPSYQKILNLIDDDSIIIENLVAVYNPTLDKLYQRKKQEKIQRYGSVYEHYLFHGTDKANLDAICKYNFDWRLLKRKRFGQGVSFSPSAQYASDYGNDEEHRVMIVARVQIANVCQGNKNMVRPPVGYDTSQKSDGNVIVKYEDNEFYPTFKLFYHFDVEESDDDDDNDDNDDYYF